MTSDSEGGMIRFTFPDAPPKEQIKQIKRMMNVMRTFAKVTGEDIEPSLQPMKDKIKELSDEIK